MRMLIFFSVLTVFSSCNSRDHKYQKIIDDFSGKDTVEIILSAYGLDRIPEEVCFLGDVKRLTISSDSGGWKIYPPPSAMAEMTEYPPFRYIPEEITNLRSLKYLSLSGLAIKRLPTKFEELSDLEYLNLSLNKLDIENELNKLKALKNLKELDIFGNKIDTASIKQWALENKKLIIRYKLDSN